MKKKLFTTIVGISAFALMFLMNFGHAINDYGILSNKLSPSVLAQGCGGGGNDCGGGGDDDCGSGGNGCGGGGNGCGSGNPYAPCETYNTQNITDYEMCYGTLMIQENRTSWSCRYFGAGGACFIGYSYSLYNCGSLVQHDYSNNDLGYSCFL